MTPLLVPPRPQGSNRKSGHLSPSVGIGMLLTAFSRSCGCGTLSIGAMLPQLTRQRRRHRRRYCKEDRYFRGSSGSVRDTPARSRDINSSMIAPVCGASRLSTFCCNTQACKENSFKYLSNRTAAFSPLLPKPLPADMRFRSAALESAYQSIKRETWPSIMSSSLLAMCFTHFSTISLSPLLRHKRIRAANSICSGNCLEYVSRRR